ncbi:hypothetical protein FE633_32140 [Streptomyces montanus]|uniref:Uncharacterized protein n=1 Tax=Streptomyces montanus TaxID=2580423 RepID=A0A5R9FG64_9ACTN|nr:DUF5819 family protein [Streptomyces montanus]TLS42171.1 hypothetical protein FE633_32140 [Streptomyces montanus]
MDAYDEGSNARHEPPSEPAATAPAASAPEPDNAGPADSPPDDRAASAGPAPNNRAVPAGPAPNNRAVPAASAAPAAPASAAPAAPAAPAPADPAPPPQDAPAPPLLPPPPPPPGIAALSPRYQVVAALAFAVVAVAACVHLGTAFLHVAPSNTVTKQHGRAIDEWVYPEFEQNWKLFAPNPLQQNIAVQVRAEVRATDGGVRTTRWYDLSALDGAAIDGNLLPSHTQQNELRRAWDFYVATHDSENRPAGLRGALSERYLRRIVVLRLDREQAGGRGAVVQQVQVRSRTTNVPPPEWSQEQVSAKPVIRELPWWLLTEADRAAGTRAVETEARAR